MFEGTFITVHAASMLYCAVLFYTELYTVYHTILHYAVLYPTQDAAEGVGGLARRPAAQRRRARAGPDAPKGAQVKKTWK